MDRLAPLFIFAATTLAASPAWADDGTAENHLVDSVIAYRNQDWKAALRALKLARRQVQSRALSAKIERQVGLTLLAVGRPARALTAFRRALALDKDLTLEADDFDSSVLRLFRCARRAPPKAPNVKTIAPDGRGGWRCPWADEASVDSAVVSSEGTRPGGPRPAPPAAPPPAALQIPAPKPDVAAGPSLSTLGGVGIGLIAAGLAAGGGVFAWQQGEASQARDDLDQLRVVIADVDPVDGSTRQLVDVYNATEEDRVAHEDNATVALAVGGGVALAGLVMLILDLSDDGTPSEGPIEVRGGPGTLTIEF